MLTMHSNATPFHNGRGLVLAVAAVLWLVLQAGVTGTVIDLGHVYRSGVTSCWNPTKKFDVIDKHTTTFTNGQRVATESFSTPEHCGTHLDAPYHFYSAGWTLEEIPLERMIAEGVHLNVSEEVNGNPNFMLTVDHLKAWERVNGPLPKRSVILVNFGWAHKFGDRESYYSSLQTPYKFPALSKDAAQWIIDSGKVFGVGVDGPSVDSGNSTTYDAHVILAKGNLFNLENVALNGTTLPPKGFKLIVQPIKIGGGTGGPVRILAFTNNQFPTNV